MPLSRFGDPLFAICKETDPEGARKWATRTRGSSWLALSNGSECARSASRPCYLRPCFCRTRSSRCGRYPGCEGFGPPRYGGQLVSGGPHLSLRLTFTRKSLSGVLDLARFAISRRYPRSCMLPHTRARPGYRFACELHEGIC